jgi:hypothetical protein
VVFVTKPPVTCFVRFATSALRSDGQTRSNWQDRILRRIVEVFVKDVRRAAYPVVLADADRPADAEFIEQVVKRMRLGAYSAEDARVAKFLVRPADRG